MSKHIQITCYGRLQQGSSRVESRKGQVMKTPVEGRIKKTPEKVK